MHKNSLYPARNKYHTAILKTREKVFFCNVPRIENIYFRLKFDLGNMINTL